MFYEFDTIKHIKNFQRCLVLCLKNDSFPKKVRYGTVWYCLVMFGNVW